MFLHGNDEIYVVVKQISETFSNSFASLSVPFFSKGNWLWGCHVWSNVFLVACGEILVYSIETQVGEKCEEKCLKLKGLSETDKMVLAHSLKEY